MELTQAIIKELLIYDPETGKLFWKKRDSRWFVNNTKYTAEQCANRWNTSHAGKEAFTYIRPGNVYYHKGRIFGKQYSAHRIIFLLVFGYLPAQIDHINGIGTDNRLINLKASNSLENHKNMRKHAKNSSGIAGISWSEKGQYWHTYINVNNKRINLGYFKDIYEAKKVRECALIEYGFSNSHGLR